jgi:hypothetical protein
MAQKTKEITVPVKMGRPIFDKVPDHIANDICEKLMDGLSLRTICKNENLPTFQTVCNWLAKDQTFFEQYARARALQSEIMADEIIEIADDASNDTKTIWKGDTAIEVENTEWTNRSKLRVEARLKLMALLNPKRFGTKVDVTTKGDKLTNITAIQVIIEYPNGDGTGIEPIQISN